MESPLIFAIVVFLVFSEVKSKTIKFIVDSLHNKIIGEKEYFEDRIIELKLKNKIRDHHKAYQDELDFLKVFLEVKGRLYFLTTIIGWVEAVFFTTATIFFLKTPHSEIAETMKQMLLISGAWIGFKLIGNYKNWEGKITGRYIFYTFILGTILSLGSSIFIGFLIGLFILH